MAGRLQVHLIDEDREAGCSSQPLITMSARAIPWIFVACLLIGAIAFCVQSPPPASDPLPRTAVAEPVRVAPAVESPAIARRAAPFCLDQKMEVAAGGVESQQCLGATHTVRNGSVVTYRVDPQDVGGRWLSVEAAGKVIVSVQLGTGGQIAYQCARDQCSGIAMSSYDAQGARSIVLNDAILLRESAAHPGEQETALVTGQLKVLPDDQAPSTTCVAQVLVINVGDESVHFCPDGGTGFDVDADYGRTYRFTNGDGVSVSVDLDAHENLRRVEYGSYSCAAGDCNGVSVSAPDTSGRRVFYFHGTVLTQDGAAALLNGNLNLDPQ